MGAPYNDNGGSRAGQVEVFIYSNDTNDEWKKLGQSLQGEAAGDDFGTSVSLSSDGRTLAVGAPDNGNGGYDAGQVEVFQN